MIEITIQNLEEAKQRFWKKVNIGGEGDCWNWTASLTHNGYGDFRYRYKTWRAHRFLWTVTNGPIPEGLRVLHKCDNRACVNLAHLFLGTDAENSADMLSKGRFPVGESHWFAKLNESKVREIRRRYNNGEYQKSIARAFGISRTGVSAIVTLRSWPHVKAD